MLEISKYSNFSLSYKSIIIIDKQENMSKKSNLMTSNAVCSTHTHPHTNHHGHSSMDY